MRINFIYFSVKGFSFIDYIRQRSIFAVIHYYPNAFVDDLHRVTLDDVRVVAAHQDSDLFFDGFQCLKLLSPLQNFDGVGFVFVGVGGLIDLSEGAFAD